MTRINWTALVGWTALVVTGVMFWGGVAVLVAAVIR